METQRYLFLGAGDDMVDRIKVGQRNALLTVSSDTPFRTGCDLRYCPCIGRINVSVRPTQKKNSRAGHKPSIFISQLESSFANFPVMIT